MISANDAWRRILDEVSLGAIVTPRGIETRELLAYQSRVWMGSPLLTVSERNLSYRFAAAEALWILTGDNRLGPLINHAPSYGRFSDDGRTLDGAYGPEVVTQLRYVVDCLCLESQTRQAVLTIWRKNPRPSKDIPCTISMQFLLRANLLHCVVNMRSSDSWLGWPYDIFSFTMIASYVGLLYTKNMNCPIQLGMLTLNSGSQHIYQSNYEKVAKIISRATMERDISTYVLTHLNSPDHLLVCLGNVRDTPNKSCHVKFFDDMGSMVSIKEGIPT